MSGCQSGSRDRSGRRQNNLLEMRYIWRRPHCVDGSALAARVPEFTPTPLEEALRLAMKPLL
ncbi:Hypothetical protein FKW44_004887 [Caligus rogercresseyi]|uniref:Uncharacterized protein n=1 Tax=Caligus rogercresseyi TaxID=217165 RepID=A0A7T8HM76_CALRO|nr:Hypothetical protein FKW44_004887 [Caligus rogercresseyi]